MPEFCPKVSIVIPVYNGSNYLREAIESALAQTYGNCEVLVVNDGSSDNGATRDIALSYGERIRYFEKENGGVSTALNMGIYEMHGEYFSWLSHDDLYHPHKIAVQIDSLRSFSDTVVLYSDYEFIDQSGGGLGVNRVEIIPPERMRLALIVSAPVNGCTVLIPKICFDRVGVFDERLLANQDYDFWFRLAKEFRFIHIPEVLIKSRLHPDQGSHAVAGHYRECAELHRGFLREIDAAELAAATGEPPGLSFARLALSLKLRGLSEAANIALVKAGQASGGEKWHTALKRLLFTVACRSIDRRMKPAYWLGMMKSSHYLKD